MYKNTSAEQSTLIFVSAQLPLVFFYSYSEKGGSSLCTVLHSKTLRLKLHNINFFFFFYSLTFLCFCHCPPDSSLRHFSVPSHLKCSHWALQNVRFALVWFKGCCFFFVHEQKKTQPSLLIRQLFPLTRKNMLLLNWQKALLASSVFFFFSSFL